MSNSDAYLDPPDFEEQEYCDSCGEELNVSPSGEARCENKYCPNKFNGIAEEMATYIVELKFELEEKRKKIAWQENKIKDLRRNGDRLDEMIAEAKDILTKF